MKLQDVKVDFQVSGWVVEKDKPARFGPVSRWFARKVEPFQKTIATIADSLYQPGENRAIGLLNYYQPKYERVVREGIDIAKKSGFEVDDNHPDVFLGLTDDSGKSWLYIIRGREYLCQQGHLMAIGTPISMHDRPEFYSYARGPGLEEVIKFEQGNGAILIPSHPLPRLGLATKAVLRLIGEPSGTRLGLDEDTIRKHAKDFDALEAYSLSMNDEQTKRVENLARELGIPTVSNSDDELDGNFAQHNQFSWLDFGNPEKLRESIRTGLRNKNNTHEEYRGVYKRPTGEKILHILLNVIQSRRYF